MPEKFGDRFVEDMIDRGHRELGGLFFEGSNIAQPMYPLRGSYGPEKEAEPKDREATFEELHPVEISRDDKDRDDRDRGMERE